MSAVELDGTVSTTETNGTKASAVKRTIAGAVASDKIPEINLARIRFTIRGTTPLITHRFSERNIEQIEEKQAKGAKVEKPPRRPLDEWQEALYTIEPGLLAEDRRSLSGGRYGFPAAGLKDAMVTAGGRFGDEKQVRLRGILSMQADLVEILLDPGEDGKLGGPRMRRDVGRLKDIKRTACLIYRPEFRSWSMRFQVTYVDDWITKAQLMNLVNIAGFSVGVGDWRPECSGTFGQFELERAEELPINAPQDEMLSLWQPILEEEELQ